MTQANVPKDLPILWRDSAAPAEYEDWRLRIYNGRKPTRYPIAIVRPKTVEQIQASIKLAADLEVKIAVRAGGHSWAGWSIRDESILIDLVDFRHLTYDGTTDTLAASPSTTSGEAVLFALKKGRFVPLGHSDSVGIGGFLLQGGMGFNCRGYGWACQYVKAVDVVTATGEFKHCNEKENRELYWAARGSGPGYPGLITRFYLRTRESIPVVKKSQYVWPISEYEACMKWVSDITQTAHIDVELFCFSRFAPELNQRTYVLWATAFGHTDEEAISKLKPLKDTGPPNRLQSEDYATMELEKDYVLSDFGDVAHYKERWVCDNVYIRPDIDFIKATKPFWVDIPPSVMVVYQPLHPTGSNPLPDMALSVQSEHYFALYAIYRDEGQDKFHADWMAEKMLELEKISVGSYMGDADFQVRPTKYWSDEAARKLQAIREKFDPEQRFCSYLTKDDKVDVQSLTNKLHASQGQFKSRV